jgi:guanylate kinase
MSKAGGSKRRKGSLFVISAPSGAGKTTLCKKLLKKYDDIKMSVSYTTRTPRRGEVNDVDYTFVTERRFRSMIARNEFAEWAMVHGNMYGTSLKRLRRMSREGYDIILDIDTRGAAQIRNSYDNAVYIFIMPPSLEVLRERLIGRKTDSEDIIRGRLNNAREEIEHCREYDYIVVNDDLKRAFRDLESIVLATRLKTEKIDNVWLNKFLKKQGGKKWI